MPTRVQNGNTLVLILSWWDVEHCCGELWKGATWRSESELLSRRRYSFICLERDIQGQKGGREVTVREEVDGEDGKDCGEPATISDCFIFYFGT